MQLDTNNIIKIVLAIAIIAVVTIYPILNVPIDPQIMSVFGMLATWLLGVSTSSKDNEDGE